MRLNRKSQQKGFTIVELMIATGIFSLILLVVLTAIIQVGRMYYKGITISKTDQAARSIIDRVSQEIQFSPAGTNPLLHQTASNGFHVRCIGSMRFFYVVNSQNVMGRSGLVGDDSAAGSDLCVSAAAMQAASGTGPGGEPTLNIGSSSNQRDLLPNNMRILKFDVSRPNPTANLYNVTVRVAYGDTDLLNQTEAGIPNSFCRGATIGTQFCAVSEFNVTVSKRL